MKRTSEIMLDFYCLIGGEKKRIFPVKTFASMCSNCSVLICSFWNDVSNWNILLFLISELQKLSKQNNYLLFRLNFVFFLNLQKPLKLTLFQFWIKVIHFLLIFQFRQWIKESVMCPPLTVSTIIGFSWIRILSLTVSIKNAYVLNLQDLPAE